MTTSALPVDLQQRISGFAQAGVERGAVTLRPYQEDAVTAVLDARAAGKQRVMVVAATGTGKTVLFSELARRVTAAAEHPARTVIIAHRDELIDQAVQKLRTVWPTVDVGVVKAERNAVDAQVVVASIQTLFRERRLRQYLAAGRPDLIVVDECFPAGTPVGSRRIEDLRVGDVVPSWDEGTGRLVHRRVVRTFRSRPSALVRVTTATGRVLVCTPGHPFATQHGWVPAGDLTTSDHVLEARGVRTSFARVDRVEVLEPDGDGRFGGLCPDGHVYNIEVEGTHTYVAGGVVVHNCHHAGAETYVTALRGLGSFDADGPLTVGVTATPNPKDRHLSSVFSDVVFRYDIGDAVDDGFLVDPVGIQVDVDGLDLDAVKVTSGDYRAADLGEAMEQAGAHDIITSAWLSECQGRRGIVFVPLVKNAHHVARAMKAAGVRAEPISGETPKDDWTDSDGNHRPGRSTLYRMLRDGGIDVLVNAQLLTEGFDEPSVDAVVVARPTKSRTAYVQMVGRGLRLHPGKTDCLIIDLHGATKTHSLSLLGEMLGNTRMVGNARVSMREARVAQREREIAEARDEQTRLALRLRTERVHLAARFSWIEVPGRPGYAMDLPGRGLLAIMQEDQEFDDSWAVGVVTPRGAPNERLAEGLSLEYAQGFAEDYARRAGADRLRAKDAEWRNRRPTARQLAHARREGCAVPRGATQGQVSDIIAAHRIRKELGRRDAAA